VAFFSLWRICPEETALTIDDAETITMDTNGWDTNLSISSKTYEYIFDANSDPLMVGRITVHWLKTNPEHFTNILFPVLLKDKAEYDAIIKGEN